MSQSCSCEMYFLMSMTKYKNIVTFYHLDLHKMWVLLSLFTNSSHCLFILLGLSSNQVSLGQVAKTYFSPLSLSEKQDFFGYVTMFGMGYFFYLFIFGYLFMKSFLKLHIFLIKKIVHTLALCK